MTPLTWKVVFRVTLFFAISFFTLETCVGSSVIIIGAGPSGIAAATKLLENGFTNITVLEAENRIGGRIHSVKFGDAYVDVGAEYCHGEEDNIVYEMAKDLNVLRHEVSQDDLDFYYSNGSKLNYEILKELVDMVSLFDRVDLNKTGLSAGDFFWQQFNSTIPKKYKNDPNRIKVLQDAMSNIEGYVLALSGSFSWYTLAADTHYISSAGDTDMTWGGHGFKTILEILMKSFPDPSQKLDIDNKILLNKTVTNIDWKGPGVKVSSADHSTYEADYVIFTPSVGVLKEKHKKLFSPELPEAKQKAIQQTGFDGVMKILMRFPTKWWGEKEITLVWSEEDRRALMDQNNSWIGHVNVLLESSNNSKVLIAWVLGEALEEIEVMPLETVKNGMNQLFDKFLEKDYEIVEPDEIIRSTWRSNPNFRGTYSFEQSEYFKPEISNQEILAEPLKNEKGKPVVLFAGEATNPIHFASVHGAIETGHREARRILKLIANETKS